MFASLGQLIHRRRWASLAVVLVLTVLCAVWGAGVFTAFKQDDFSVPGAESTRVAQLSVSYFGSTNPDVLVLYQDPNRTVDDPTFMRDVLTTVARLPQSQVSTVTSYWSTHLKEFVSRDRHATFVSLKLAGDDTTRLNNYLGPQKDPAHPALAAMLVAPGLRTQLGGSIPLGQEFSTQMMKDIVTAESVTLPLVALLALLIFGSFAAFWLPLLTGIFAIVGGFAVLRVLTMVTSVSNFALEVVTMLGLGLAIDYSLFIVTRFREELAKGRDRGTALSNTMATAGRTVAFSGVTFATALSGLLIFPQMFLRSLGLGGISVVIVAVVSANVVLPTVLALLGPRIEFGQMPWRKRKARRLARDRAAGREPQPEQGFWYRLGWLVMRRPLPFLLGVLVILGVLFMPFLHTQFGTVDARTLPKDSPTRQVVQYVKDNFPGSSTEPIDIVVSGDYIPPNWRPDPTVKDDKPPLLEDFRRRLLQLPHVTQVEYSGYSADFGGVRISVTHNLDSMSAGAQSLVATIRSMRLDPPPGQHVYVDVGGSTAGQMDSMAALNRTLPWMVLFVGVMTSILLFAAFGSVLLPLKAVVMNVLSIGASFGAIVWGFQDGHLAGVLDFTPTGTIEATTIILILAMVFGLSMDYEVFLLSRIREEWDRVHDNRAAVAHGMQKTGGIISQAALLILVVIGAFSMAGITVVKLLGVGMFVAVVVDASLVRSLLVPATMRYLGDANWWLPGPLAKLHRRIDLREVDELPSGPRERRPADRRPVDRRPAERPAERRPAERGQLTDDVLSGYATIRPYNGAHHRPPTVQRDPNRQAGSAGPGSAAHGTRIQRTAPAGSDGHTSFRWVSPPRPGTAARILPAENGSSARFHNVSNKSGTSAGAGSATRKIIPNPDGPGWQWSTAEEKDASEYWW